VIEAEVRMLAAELEPFGMLSREELARRTHAALWHEGTFDTALRLAVRCGAVELSPTGLVVLHRFPAKREIRKAESPEWDEGRSEREHVAELLERAGEHHARAAHALERAAAERQAWSRGSVSGKPDRSSRSGEELAPTETSGSPKPVESESEAATSDESPPKADSSAG
jgi:hypothetical protein